MAVQTSEIIFKTDATGIDGADDDDFPTYYLKDTPSSNGDTTMLQKPVAADRHALLNSWQRRPDPREFDELTAGGNGASAHDETSEDLAVAFREERPTPNSGARGLDLAFAGAIVNDTLVSNGEPNGIVNPSETIALSIKLTNLGVQATGPLYTELRTLSTPFVTLGADSVSAFDSIAPGDTVTSTKIYVFTTADTLLPPRLFFRLLIIQKIPEGQKRSAAELASEGPAGEVEVVISTENVTLKMVDVQPTLVVNSENMILQLSHRVAYTLETGPTAETMLGKIAPVEDILIDTTRTDMDQETDYGDIMPGDTSLTPQTFELATSIPFVGNEAPNIVVELSWLEGQGDDQGEVRRQIPFTWLPLDSFAVQGTVKYFNGDKTVAGVVVSLQSADTTRTDTTGTDGKYSFKVLASNAGAYKITANRSGVPQGAITRSDRDTAEDLADSPPQPFGHEAVFEQIAADVNRDSVVNYEGQNKKDNDIVQIVEKVADSCHVFPVGKDWIFVDSGTPVTNEFFFRAADTLTLALLNYNFEHLDFAGILYGDVDTTGTNPNADTVVCTGRNAAGASQGHKNYFFIQDQKLAPGGVFDLPLHVEGAQRIRSAEIDLAFDETQLEFVSITKTTSVKNLTLSHSHEPGRLHARLSGTAPSGSAGDILIVTFRAIGKEGQTSLLELTEFSVNQGPIMQATARVRIVEKVPDHFSLSQNYPNPFNPATTIEYGLPEEAHVRLQIFNLLGQLALTLVDEKQKAGYHRVEWSGRDQDGRSLPSGLYVMRMQAGSFSQVRKLALMK